MNIEEIKRFANTIKHCGDYGELWVNEDIKTVVWVAGDADFEVEDGHTSWQDVEAGFLRCDGVDIFEFGDEDSPGEHGRNNWICLGKYGIEI